MMILIADDDHDDDDNDDNYVELLMMINMMIMTMLIADDDDATGGNTEVCVFSSSLQWAASELATPCICSLCWSVVGICIFSVTRRYRSDVCY